MTMVDRNRKLGGFSLVELMVTLSVLAILVTLAAPSFVEWLARSRISSETNELVGDISFARSESATRGARITICASSDGSTCSTATPPSWEAGRIIFVDTDGNGARTGAETLLRSKAAFSGNTTVTMSGFPNAYIQFRPYGGLSPATTGAFKLCSTSIADGKQVAVAVSGRPQASKVSCP
jgi:type IV fimbrial biogenesis protein FimT